QFLAADEERRKAMVESLIWVLSRMPLSQTSLTGLEELDLVNVIDAIAMIKIKNRDFKIQDTRGLLETCRRLKIRQEEIREYIMAELNAPTCDTYYSQVLGWYVATYGDEKMVEAMILHGLVQENEEVFVLYFLASR